MHSRRSSPVSTNSSPRSMDSNLSSPSTGTSLMTPSPMGGQVSLPPFSSLPHSKPSPFSPSAYLPSASYSDPRYSTYGQEEAHFDRYPVRPEAPVYRRSRHDSPPPQPALVKSAKSSKPAPKTAQKPKQPLSCMYCRGRKIQCCRPAGCEDTDQC